MIVLQPPYEGQTADAVGIGSQRAKVECAYGPSKRPESPDNWYTAAGVLHWVRVGADTVASIWILDRAFVNQAE